MQNVLLILSLAFLAPMALFGQTKIIKTSVYFDNDEFDLRIDGKQTIDKILDTLPRVIIFKIIVAGNADNSADSLYNLKLSDKRAGAVKNYLTARGIKENIISSSYHGEEKPIAKNDNDEGKQKNRRVDITFFYKQKVSHEHAVVDTIPKLAVALDSCQSKDTIVTLPQGTEVVFNRCEYIEIKDCLEFTETNNPQDVLMNGLSLMDTSGFPIASCGMLKVTMKPGCTNRECFKIPVKVRFPVPKDKECDFCGRDARVWDITSNGSWVQGRGKKSEIKIIKIQGQMFYQFELFCPNSFKNCDCKPKGKRIKFKTKRNYQIINIQVTFDCPTAVVKFQPNKRKNIAKLKIPCWKGNKTVLATIINNKGDTLILKQQPLNDLTKRTIFSKCKKIEGAIIGYRLGVFPVSKRQLYRKYIIKPNQLTAQ